jgi:hypothetical protein
LDDSYCPLGIRPSLSRSVNDILQAIERHKDLADLAIKAVGMGLTLAGAGCVAWKYFADKKQARLQKELDLRRDAYFGLFAAIPLQLAALGRFAGKDDQQIALVEDSYKALLRLHLLASHDALKCIIDRNAIYHIGVIDLTALKRTARQLNAVVDAGRSDMMESNLRAWEAFRARFRRLIADLNSNYRELLVFARREIDDKGDLSEILAALKRDEEAALGALDQMS